MKSKIILGIFCIISFVSNVHAQSFVPSQQQIQQFKNLPRSQQEQLARQMGFDLSLLDQINNSNSTNEPNKKEVETVEREVDEKQISEELSRQSIVKEKSKELKPFGYSMFNTENSSFESISNIPVPSDYIIGAGDSLNLRLFGKETGQFELLVDSEGNIDIPELGPLNLAGLSYQEAKSKIVNIYNQQKIGVQPFISMGELRTIQVFLVGEVYRPGSLTVNSLSTLSTVLFNGGGVSELGSLRNVVLKRAGNSNIIFDFYDLLIRGDVSKDVRLQQGDVIFVPIVDKLVSISGQVRRPAIYEMKADENLNDLIDLAGGLLPVADASAVQIVRNVQGKGLSIITSDVSDSSDSQLAIMAGDFVNINESRLEFSDAVKVQGAINSPSLLSIAQKPTLSELVTDRTILKNTDLNYALIIRKPKYFEKTSIIQFSPKSVLAKKFDVKLRAFDQILFFNKFSNENETSKLDSEIADRDLKSAGTEAIVSDNGFLSKMTQNAFTTAEFDINMNGGNNTRRTLLAGVLAQVRSEADESHPVQLAEIAGQVRYPGVYPLASNDSSLTALINAAGGLTEAAHLEQIEISNFQINEGGANVQHISLNLLNELTKPVKSQYQLSSKDVVSIARIPDWLETNSVELKGEFVFPGIYQIAKGETLSDLIKRAGGFTEEASLEAAVFMREELKAKERANIDKAVEDLKQQLANNNLSNSQFSRTIDYENATEILKSLTDIKPVGRLVIDLEHIVSEDSNFNVELKSGDVLIVPNITPAISVIGEVFLPSTHWYDSRKAIDDYIELSGGIREYGDESKIYIVRANGAVFVPKSKFWFDGNSDYVLKPGDTIVIPRDITNYDNLSLWQGVTQILYQTAVALAAVGSL